MLNVLFMTSFGRKRCDVTSRVVMAPPSGRHCRKRNRATSSSDVIDLTTFADDDDVTPPSTSHQVANNSPLVVGGMVSDVGSDVDEGCDVNHDV